MSHEKKMKLFIDGDAILSERPSGIGTATVAIIRALSENKEFISRYTIYIVVAANKTKNIKRWNFNETVHVKRSVLPGRVLNGLLKANLLPPMDIIFGKGVYLFPNFRNWPLLRSPSITYVHDVSFKVYPEYVETKNLAFLEKNIHTWIKRSHRIITVSNHALHEIDKFFPDTAKKTSVVYNGIDETFTPITSEEAGDILSRYNLSYKNYFIFLSNLEPRKNVATLLKAYKVFCDEMKTKDIPLLLVGGMSWGSDGILELLQSMQAEGYRIIKPSHYVADEELPALLSGAISLVHPAFYEGFGISPLQAMACGTWVIVGNNSSLPEVVGDGGIYVSPQSIPDIASAMKKANKDKSILNTRGIARARQFTWQKSAQDLVDVIEQVVERKR